jgi:hypothetical protein
VYTPEPFVPERTALVLRLLSGSWKRYKPPGIDQIPAELIQAGGGGECIPKSINLLSWSGTKKNYPTSEKSKLTYIITKRVIKLTVVIIEAYHYCKLHTKFCTTFFL